jgi:hypothetical protein
MKAKHLLYGCTVLLFTVLFFQQSFGLNYLLFAIALISGSLYLNPQLLTAKNWLIAAIGTLIATFFTTIYGNAFTVWMSILSILILMVMNYNPKSSFIVALMSGVIAVVGTIPFMIHDRSLRQKIKLRTLVQPSMLQKRALAITVSLGIAILFLVLYRSISPVFDAYISRFVDSISWLWLSFTLLGTVLLYTFYFHPRLIRRNLRIELRYGRTIDADQINKNPLSVFGENLTFDTEKFTALLILAILNIMLLGLNMTDIHQLIFIGEMPEGVSYTDYVHNGVGAVIVSILLAIGIILFYFRGRMNFDSQSTTIKALAYTWLAQNLVLVTLTMLKNGLYVQEFFLTYKRIGVFFYLLFSVIGLILSIYKIWAKKDTWYLFKANSLVFYVVLIVACSFNWNVLVTSYNLKHDPNPDYYYLTQLGYETYPVLWKHNAFAKPVVDIVSESGVNISVLRKRDTVNVNKCLPYSISRFLDDFEENGWQSYCYEKQKTYQYFKELVDRGDVVRFCPDDQEY